MRSEAELQRWFAEHNRRIRKFGAPDTWKIQKAVIAVDRALRQVGVPKEQVRGVRIRLAQRLVSPTVESFTMFRDSSPYWGMADAFESWLSDVLNPSQFDKQALAELQALLQDGGEEYTLPLLEEDKT